MDFLHPLSRLIYDLLDTNPAHSLALDVILLPTLLTSIAQRVSRHDVLSIAFFEFAGCSIVFAWFIKALNGFGCDSLDV